MSFIKDYNYIRLSNMTQDKLSAFKRLRLEFLLLVIVVLLLMLISPSYLTGTYLKRIVLYRESDINDYQIFPNRILNKSSSVFLFESGVKVDTSKVFEGLTYKFEDKENKISNFNSFLTSTGTTSFIIIKDDKLIFEEYFNDYKRESMNTSISMAKSYTSALIGIAIEEGFINSVDDSIADYLPELKSKGLENTTIKDLLSMTSEIKYTEGPLFFGDDARTYYSEDLRKLALDVDKKTGDKNFLYNNYHPLLLGMILERATHQSVTEYLNNKIWKEIGTEFDGSWSLDSENGFEKMESGINARSIDFAKLGRLYLSNGKWGDKQIIPEKWARESTSGQDKDSQFYSSLKEWKVDLNKTTYGYLWWNYKRDNSTNDFYARGKYGQYIYVSPSTNTVIVRNGKDAGDVDFWPEILYQITNRLS